MAETHNKEKLKKKKGIADLCIKGSQFLYRSDLLIKF